MNATSPYLNRSRLSPLEVQLVEALDHMTAKYVQLVDSGDCGFWEPRNEPEVEAAYAALDAAYRAAHPVEKPGDVE